MKKVNFSAVYGGEVSFPPTILAHKKY